MLTNCNNPLSLLESQGVAIDRKLGFDLEAHAANGTGPPSTCHVHMGQ